MKFLATLAIAALASLAMAKKPTTTTTCTTTSSPPASESCSETMCVDSINECGMMYGGCYPACSGLPTPTFSKPPCPTTKTKTKKHCTKTKCVDYVNDCGQTYGGCFKACRGHKTPTFTDPGCPATTAGPTTSDVPDDCPYICEDLIDDCGDFYGGGCYSSCPGVPKPSLTTYAPPCTTGSATVTPA